MTIHLKLFPMLTLLAGVLILVRPKFLHYIVAIYLIALGLLGPSGLLR